MAELIEIETKEQADLKNRIDGAAYFPLVWTAVL